MVYVASSRFNPGTVIDGVDMSFKTLDEAEQIVGEKYKGYEIVVKYRDGESNGSDLTRNMMRRLNGS